MVSGMEEGMGGICLDPEGAFKREGRVNIEG